MKNNLESLNNYLFEAIERLNEELEGEVMTRELQRADMVLKVSRQIIDNTSLSLQVKKHFDEYGENNYKVVGIE